MPTTANGEVSLYYEVFGAEGDPVLLLEPGTGGQCISFKVEFCEKFADRGFRVVRLDNRDVGLSSHLKGASKYTLDDMAKDGVAVIDAVNGGAAHVAGWSQGGMIVQTMALKYPERVLSMTSVMSAPNLRWVPESDREVMAVLNAPPATTREELAENYLAGERLWGSPAFFDVDRITADAYAAFDRSWDPESRVGHAMAVTSSPSREVALGSLKVPALVIHGDADRLAPLGGGRATADAIPGAHLEIIEGLGHDYQYGDRVVELITAHAKTSAAAG